MAENQGKMRILYVQPEDSGAETAQAYARRYDCSVFWVRGHEGALAAIAQEDGNFDAVITTLNVPDLDEGDSETHLEYLRRELPADNTLESPDEVKETRKAARLVVVGKPAFLILGPPTDETPKETAAELEREQVTEEMERVYGIETTVYYEPYAWMQLVGGRE